MQINDRTYCGIAYCLIRKGLTTSFLLKSNEVSHGFAQRVKGHSVVGDQYTDRSSA